MKESYYDIVNPYSAHVQIYLQLLNDRAEYFQALNIEVVIK